jgi:hypothetical protein
MIHVHMQLQLKKVLNHLNIGYIKENMKQHKSRGWQNYLENNCDLKMTCDHSRSQNSKYINL